MNAKVQPPPQLKPDFWSDDPVDVDELHQHIEVTVLEAGPLDDPTFGDVRLRKDSIVVGFSGQKHEWPDPPAEAFIKHITADNGESYPVICTPRPFELGPTVIVTFDLELGDV